MLLILQLPFWSPLTQGVSVQVKPQFDGMCLLFWSDLGTKGLEGLIRKISISLCPYSAMDRSSAKHFIVTFKPNNILQGKWLANSQHRRCRKVPTSLPGFNAFKETLEWRSLYNQSDFFHSPFVEISFTQGLKKKGKNKKQQQRKRKPALNEKFQSCLCKNPPSPSQLPLPLYPGLCVSLAKGLESCWKTFSCCIETDIWQSSVVS